MKRYLRIIMPILAFLVVLFILSNSFSNADSAMAKRDFVVKTVTGKTFAKQISAIIAKIFHMMEYAAFSFCLTSSVLLLGDGLKSRFERILLCGILLAITDELIQSLFSGRGSKLTDVLVDTAGIMIGYAVSILLAALIRKRNGKKRKES